MSAIEVTGLFREALFLAMTLVTVIILPSLVVGLIVATFQAATQINEQTLSFLPRLIVTLLVLAVYGPWLASLVHDFSHSLIMEIPHIVG